MRVASRLAATSFPELGAEFVIAYGVTGVEGKSSLVECNSVSIGERLVDLGSVRKHPGKGMPLLREGSQ